jgi:hypothetical protein
MLADAMDAAQKARKASLTPLYWAAARVYSALKARMDFGGMHHVHQPASPGPVHDGPVPRCCGSPGWLRPSGWQCSRCGISLDEREVS